MLELGCRTVQFVAVSLAIPQDGKYRSCQKKKNQYFCELYLFTHPAWSHSLSECLGSALYRGSHARSREVRAPSLLSPCLTLAPDAGQGGGEWAPAGTTMRCCWCCTTPLPHTSQRFCVGHNSCLILDIPSSASCLQRLTWGLSLGCRGKKDLHRAIPPTPRYSSRRSRLNHAVTEPIGGVWLDGNIKTTSNCALHVFTASFQHAFKSLSQFHYYLLLHLESLNLLVHEAALIFQKSEVLNICPLSWGSIALSHCRWLLLMEEPSASFLFSP